MFQVEDVIAKQFPKLVNKPRLYRSSVSLMRALFHEQDFIGFERDYPHLTGLDFVEQVLDYFGISYAYRDCEKLNIPASGRVVAVSNHPIGSLDALVLIKLLSEVRRDIKVMANHHLSQLVPLRDCLIPVDNLTGATTRESVQSIRQHMANEGLLLIFPAGEVSRLRVNGIRDPHWQKGFIKIAKSYQAPILPIHISGKNSALFYSLSLLYKPMSSFLLVKEMFKQKAQNFSVRIGEQVLASELDDTQLTQSQLANQFRQHIYALFDNKSGRFNTQKSIALPENKANLSALISSRCQHLGETNDGKIIYLYEYSPCCEIMREVGRLREIAFRAVGEGTNKKRDIDKYDSTYKHLLLWDPSCSEIIGAYRIGRSNQIIKRTGVKGLYSSTLFEYDNAMAAYFEQGLELGRSFVQPKYWGKRSLDYLWYGIGAYLRHHPELRYLFGPVSISGAFDENVKSLLINFYSTYFKSSNSLARAKCKVVTGQSPFNGEDYQAEFKLLKQLLKQQGASVPTLYKQYSELCEPSGVQFLDFSLDKKFNNCIDGLVLVDLSKLKENKRKRYLQ